MKLAKKLAIYAYTFMTFIVTSFLITIKNLIKNKNLPCLFKVEYIVQTRASLVVTQSGKQKTQLLSSI